MTAKLPCFTFSWNKLSVIYIILALITRKQAFSDSPRQCACMFSCLHFLLWFLGLHNDQFVRAMNVLTLVGVFGSPNYLGNRDYEQMEKKQCSLLFVCPHILCRVHMPIFYVSQSIYYLCIYLSIYPKHPGQMNVFTTMQSHNSVPPTAPPALSADELLCSAVWIINLYSCLN